MALNSIFPEGFSSGNFTIEEIAGKLLYFQEQIHLLHWQTENFAEHKALGKLYEYIQDFRDDVVEKLIGYTGKRPKAFKCAPLTDGIVSSSLVSEIKDWAYKLYEWAGDIHYCDVENKAQELSGEAAKCLYLLTLS